MAEYTKLEDDKEPEEPLRMNVRRSVTLSAYVSPFSRKWFAIKVATTPLLLFFLPYLVLDVFLNDFFCTHNWVLAWYVLETSPANRRVYFDTIRSTWKYWLSGLLLFCLIWTLPFIVVYGVWSNQDNDTNLNIWLVRLCFAIPTVLSVIVIGVITTRQDDYSAIDYPSSAIRFKNWQNWVALLSITYDLFTLMSLFVRPEVPYPEDSGMTDVFSQSWQQLGINQQALSYWLSFSLAFLWIGIAMYAFLMMEVYKDASKGLNNKYMITLIPLLTQTLFLFISVNLLTGLKSYVNVSSDATESFLNDYSTGFQQAVTVVALQTMIYYGVSAMMYGGVLNARSDNIFADERLDIKFKQSYVMIESLLKQILAASNIFTQGKSNLLVPSLVVSLVICTAIFGLNLWMQPCCIKTVNILKEIIFGFLMWGSVSSLIATTRYGSESTTVRDSYVPVIILFLGWLAIISYAAFYYKRHYKHYTVEDGLYVWGFTPPDQESEIWWRAERPTLVEVPQLRWRASACGGHPFTFALSEDGGVYTTGINDRGQLGHNDDTYRYRFTLIFDLWKQAALVKEIRSGSEHSLLLTRSGSVWTVGRGTEGQLGHGDTEDLKAPKPIQALNKVIISGVSAGESHSLVVAADGRVWAFGSARHGRLGLGEPQSDDQVVSVPTQISLRSQAVTVSCGSRHSAILFHNGSLATFGHNDFGQLGLGDTDTRFRPTIINNDDIGAIISVECGGEHTLILNHSFTVYACGRGNRGQLGTGGVKDESRFVPIKMDEKVTFKTIEAGYYQSAAITTDNQLYTWGSGTNCCNGHPDGVDLLTPTLVRYGFPKGTQIVEISCGQNHSTAVDLQGRLWTWGTSNSFCGLGYRPTSVTGIPAKRHVRLQPGEELTELSVGANHLMFVTSEGRLMGLGSSHDGQLGIGGISSADSSESLEGPEDGPIEIKLRTVKNSTLSVPREICGPLKSKKVKNVSCGFFFTGVVTEDGECYTFGKGDEGQLGQGSKIKHLMVPTLVEALKDKKMKQISCGFYHTVAVSQDGQVYAWGSNGKAIDDFYQTLPRCRGLLGYDEKESTEENSWTPIPVKGFDGAVIKQVSCGFAHNLAVTEEGKLYTWGYGYFGPLGHGETKNEPHPRLVMRCVEESITVKWAVCGLIHTVLLTDEGKVYTHGMGGHSQLGHGSTEWQLYPTFCEKLWKEGKVEYISAGTYQTAVVFENGQIYIWGSYLLGALGVGDVYRPLLSPQILGPLLGRRNKKVECGNHLCAAI